MYKKDLNDAKLCAIEEDCCKEIKDELYTVNNKGGKLEQKEETIAVSKDWIKDSDTQKASSNI